MAHTENTPPTSYRFAVGIGSTLDGPAVETVYVDAPSDEAAVVIVQASHDAADGGPAFIASVAIVDEDDEYMDEGPTCPSCDGCISPTAAYCPCGAVLVELADPFEGMTFEERMTAEVHLENEERAAMGAPLIPVL